ncbi:MAG TPA: O-antigen ligase family protein, partial [bacterium]|nr:O-antigen ligase family protein [bacterium]
TWLLPLFVAAILGSLMRHLWLALTIYLVWLLITLGSDRASLKKLVAKYLALVIVIFSLGIFVANLMPHSQLTQSLGDQRGYLATRLFSLFDDGDTSIAWRGTLWNNAWSNFLDTPLTGAGLGQKIFIDMGSYKDYVELRNIHNSFLAVLTQLGAVGLLLLLVFVLAQLIKIWTFKVRSNLDLIVRYSVSGIIIFCTIAFMFQPYLEANFFSIWWWLFLGLGHAYYESTLS